MSSPPHPLTGTEGTEDTAVLRNHSPGLSDQKWRNHKPREKTKTEVFLVSFFPLPIASSSDVYYSA